MTPEEKAGEVMCGIVDDEDRDDCPYLYDLEYQLAQSYYWSGNFLKDLVFFVCNWHPFFGMFLSHPRHPWSKGERFGTFIVSCSITMLPSALMVRNMERSGFTRLETNAMIFFGITLPVLVIEVSLYWLGIGDIFCKGGFCHFLSWIVYGLKRCCFCCSFGVSFLSLGFSALLLGDA